MKTDRLLKFLLCLNGIAPLFIGAHLYAAPLAWFPGPSVDPPFSGAATTMVSSRGNVLIGGDGFAYYYFPLTYPESLAATNLYWNYLPAIDTLRIAPGAVTKGGMIILYGGTDGTNSTSAVIGYSPSGDTPLTLASMSVPRSYLGYAPDAKGNAYAIGGLDGNGQPLSSAECYNQDSGAWSAIAGLPAARYNFPAVFNQTNYIYIFGGRTNTTAGTETATVLRYSVKTNVWTAMAPMPVATAGSAAALGPDGKIYVVGGVSGDVTTSAVQVYDPIANSWTISTPLPEDLSGSAMGVDSLGRLMVMGGMDANGNDVGDVWRSQQFGVADSAPTFTQFPGTSGSYQVAYNSAINATGSPPPTYSLVSGPAGMQVDYYSGAITWTPQGLDQIGNIPVTIQAANYAGSTNWTFIINVPNPSPTLPTNLYVVSTTEFTVTLAWAPEDPMVGSASFNVFIPHPWHDPRGSGGGVNYQLVGSSTSTNVTISNLTPNTSYTFDVNASAPGGTSGYAGVTARTLGPQPPANLRVTGLSSTSTSLAWDPSPGPVPIARYEIWGWINNGVTSTSYGTNFSGTAATITGLVPGSVHEWGVRAYDAAGYVSGFDYGPTAVNPVPTPATLTTAAAANFVTSSPRGFQFAGQSAVVETTLVQATTNLSDPASWVTIATNPPGSAFIFTDTNASQFPTRFYRVISP